MNETPSKEYKVVRDVEWSEVLRDPAIFQKARCARIFAVSLAHL